MKTPWPFRHLGLKAVSVGFALILWMAISGEETVERGLRVPLELQQFPADLELQGPPPALVDVRVRGSSDTLSRLGAGDIVAVLDLRPARPGRRLFQLTPDHVRAPFGVEVVQVAPASIVFVFEPSAVKRLPVVPAVEGEPAPGYVRGPVSAEPATVEVVGPESAVKQATEALTDQVTIAGATAPVTEEATVGLLDPALRVRGQRTVTVRVQIMPGPRERTLRERPVRLRDQPASLAAQAVPPTVTVVIRGTREGLSQIDPDEVVPYVDLKGLGAGEYTLAVHVDAVGDAGIARIDPAVVQVRLTPVRP